MSTMKGSCLCGAVRYEAKGEPLFQGFCQCLDCRKVGAGHYAAIGMPEQAVTITGEYRSYGKKGDSGQVIHRNFCPSCGGMVFDKGGAFPGIVILNAALLDEPESFKPQMVVYARSALAWDHLDASLTRFETLPPQG